MGVLSISQDPSTIQHEEGPSGDVYAMPQKTGKKKKKEAEAEVEEMSEDQKAALYSVPDRKGQKSKSEGVSMSCTHHLQLIHTSHSQNTPVLYIYHCRTEPHLSVVHIYKSSACCCKFRKEVCSKHSQGNVDTYHHSM